MRPKSNKDPASPAGEAGDEEEEEIGSTGQAALDALFSDEEGEEVEGEALLPPPEAVPVAAVGADEDEALLDNLEAALFADEDIDLALGEEASAHTPAAPSSPPPAASLKRKGSAPSATVPETAAPSASATVLEPTAPTAAATSSSKRPRRAGSQVSPTVPESAAPTAGGSGRPPGDPVSPTVREPPPSPVKPPRPATDATGASAAPTASSQGGGPGGAPEAPREAAEPDNDAAAAEGSERPATDGQRVRPEPGDPGFDESRFMLDQNGERLYKWKVDYAARAGGGRAMCKDQDCLERHEQGGEKLIEKGALRIGRRVLMKGGRGGDGEATVMMLWYHARCIFNTFLRARKATRVIQAPEDLEGFADIHPEDQDMLRRFISCNEDIRTWRGRAGGVGGASATPAPGRARAPAGTPEKGGANTLRGTRYDDGGAFKKRKVEEEARLRKGDRVWTFCRVRPPPGEAVAVAVKSPKPELGMIVEEEKDGHLIIQFEKAEDEKDRIEKFMSRRGKRLRPWLRYPRVFEGKKQRIPLNWVQTKRPPPKLCGCNKQQWAHGCECGISCSRGSSNKVWGVDQ